VQLAEAVAIWDDGRMNDSCLLYPLTCGAPAGSLADVLLGIAAIALLVTFTTLLLKAIRAIDRRLR
jgi:hypothetical protein